VYLSIGVFPAEAQRDLEILGLMGQLAFCPTELQNIKQIIEHNLSFYTDGFHGWIALIRTVCRKYLSTRPLLYFKNPWRPDRSRWRQNCKEIVGNYWDSLLKEEAKGEKIAGEF
jgi:hypothetical protein